MSDNRPIVYRFVYDMDSHPSLHLYRGRLVYIDAPEINFVMDKLSFSTQKILCRYLSMRILPKPVFG